MVDEEDPQPGSRPREGERDKTPDPVSVDDGRDPEPTRSERVRRRVKQALVGIGGAVGVGLLAWGANRFLNGEPEVSVYPSTRVHPGYLQDFAEPDGSPPAHWHMPASHDAMHRRVQGSFEMGKRR